MIFREGLVHGDLHPGNLFVRGDGTLVVVDFGFVVELSPTVRQEFARLFYAMAGNDGAECARVAIRNATARSADFDEDGFIRAVSGLVAEFRGKTAGEFEVATSRGGSDCAVPPNSPP